MCEIYHAGMARHANTAPIDYQYEAGLLAEECGEVAQIIGKTFRHGWDSFDPAHPTISNLDLVHGEVADVIAAVDFAVERGMLDPDIIDRKSEAKLKKLRAIAPLKSMKAENHMVEVVVDDGGLSAKEEKIAVFVGSTFIVILLAVVAIASSYFTAREGRLEAALRARECYVATAGPESDKTACDALARLAGAKE